MSELRHCVKCLIIIGFTLIIVSTGKPETVKIPFPAEIGKPKLFQYMTAARILDYCIRIDCIHAEISECIFKRKPLRLNAVALV